MTLSDLPLFSPPRQNTDAPTEVEASGGALEGTGVSFVGRQRKPKSTQGEALKERGLSLVDAAEPEDWKARADQAIAELAKSGAEFGAEEVRAIAGDPEHPNAMGARFSAAAKAGLIKYLRHEPSNRPQLHRCAVRVWRGKQPGEG